MENGSVNKRLENLPKGSMQLEMHGMKNRFRIRLTQAGPETILPQA